MIVQDDDAKTLLHLGLSGSQAKVYLALVTLGKANGRTIWKCSGVARQDIYRVLSELQEKGLIEKTISKPTEFKGAPIQEGLEILLMRKNKEYEEIEKKTRNLILKLKTNQEDTATSEEDSQFYLVPSKEASLQRIKKCIATAEESIDIGTSWRKFLQLTSTQMDDLVKALSRGVKYRWVITKPDEGVIVPKMVQNCMEKLSCEFRYAFLSSPEATVAVFDKKEVLVATEAKKPFYLDSAMLWSNNASFVTAMQHYFDLIWDKTEGAKF